MAAFDPQPLQGIVRAADAGGVHQGERHAVKHQLALQQIAGGARHVGHDRPIAAAQQVQQAALAHVGPADDRHPQALAEPFALVGLGHQGLQLRAHRHQLSQDRRAIEGRQILLEIHPRLQFGQLVKQPLPQGRDAALNAAIEARHRQLGRPPAAGADHRRHRLGPGQIEAPVEKGPLAELAGSRPPRTRRQHQLQHPAHRLQSAMAVQFHHVLAGEAAGGAHQQQQHLIHPFSAGRIDHMAVEHPMALPELLAGGDKDLSADRLGPGAREAHNRHTAGPGRHRRGNGGNGVRAMLRGLLARAGLQE